MADAPPATPAAAATVEVIATPVAVTEIPAETGIVHVPAPAAPPPRVPPARENPPARPRPLELPADTEFNGELIRQIRKNRGMSLQVLAERTRIGTRHLENVEADRYDALPPAVYLRGILMSLARELGVDPVRVSKSYLDLVERAKSRLK